MGLDIGKKHIGVAISDRTRQVAQALTTIKRGGFSSDLNKIEKLIEEYEVNEVVVGIPYNLSGEVGAQAKETQKYKEKLEGGLKLAIKIWDERFTTAEAEKVLKEAEVKGRKKRAFLDRLAASFILQSYLDSKKRK